MDSIRSFIDTILVPQFSNHIDTILPEMHFNRKDKSFVSKYHTDGRLGSGNMIQSQIHDGSSVVVDYGSSGKSRNVISMYMDFNGITDRKTAIAQICSICNVSNPFDNTIDFSLNHKKEMIFREYVKPQVEYAYHELTTLHTLEDNKNNNFLNAFFYLFEGTIYEERAKEVIDSYHVGTARYGQHEFVSFPYIDNKIREIKLMQYEPETLHRCGKTTNVHSMEKNMDFSGKLKPRLFGYHLALMNRHKQIAIVESEKTALIMAVCEPTYIWLATGGCNRLNERTAELLCCRNVRIFFDAEIDDAIRSEKTALLRRFCNDVVYKDDRKALKKCGEKADIADLYIPKLKELQNVPIEKAQEPTTSQTEMVKPQICFEEEPDNNYVSYSNGKSIIRIHKRLLFENS